MTIGDAPTFHGPPVSLSWEYNPNATEERELEQYEDYRKSVPRREKKAMRLPPVIRQHLLTENMGYSRGQIKGATDEAKRCAKQRQKTVERLRLQPVEEAFEKIKRFRKRNLRRERGECVECVSGIW
eukprot:CAMPEP_0196195620 /NCGR_PEP_ID=MMETSP0912-20130531/734_1 /TAXON_ID=49265 /ORGANISM="Thalassiosira rotula, Strain GSO102" /LENGTH=126 /DNA_ID=CAMNT_0041468157 /DNA_START=105 /DNA_END=482 /DNA_ORIENTATION=-